MATDFYYLVGSLPLLRLGDAPPLDSAAFLERCRSELSAAQFARLERAALCPASDAAPPVAETEQRWQAWETYLRNTVVRVRVARQKLDPGPWLRPETDVFPSQTREIEEILAKDDPAARELALDETRWRRLDELASGHMFDLDALVIYRLRLLLVEKWTALDDDEGRAHRDRLVADLVEQAHEQRTATEQQTAT